MITLPRLNSSCLPRRARREFFAIAAAVSNLFAPGLALAEDAPAPADVPAKSDAGALSFGRTFGLPAGQETKFIIIGAGVLRTPMNLTSLAGPEKCNESSTITCPPLPGLQYAYSLTLGLGLTPTVLGFLDLQAVTGFANFNPQLSLGVGPAILVAKGFMINPQLVYSPNFYYANGAPASATPKGAPGETNHVIGLSVAFGFIRPPVLFCPIVAASYDITSQQWVMLFAIKVGTPLWIL